MVAFTSFVDTSDFDQLMYAEEIPELDKNYSQVAMVFGKTTSGADFQSITSTGNYWFHFKLMKTNSQSAKRLVGTFDAAGQKELKIYTVLNEILISDKDDKTLWIIDTALNSRTVDLHFVGSFAQNVTCYIDEVKQDAVHVASNNKVTKLSSAASSGSSLWLTEIVASDYDTRGQRLVVMPPKSPGAFSTWIGDITSPSGIIKTAEFNVVSSFKTGVIDRSVVGNRSVVGVEVVVEAKRDTTSPDQSARMDAVVVRNNKVQKSKGMNITPDGVWHKRKIRWDDNPETGKAWTIDELNIVEFGVRS